MKLAVFNKVLQVTHFASLPISVFVKYDHISDLFVLTLLTESVSMPVPDDSSEFKYLYIVGWLHMVDVDWTRGGYRILFGGGVAVILQTSGGLGGMGFKL